MTQTNTLLPNLYTTMKRIRTFEERVGELFIKGETAGTMLHLSIGEELGPTCLGAAMQKQDTFTTHHRGHGIFIARGGDPKKMMAEIAGDSAFGSTMGGIGAFMSVFCAAICGLIVALPLLASGDSMED